MSNKTLILYKFDDFCLDTNQRCLLYADLPVSLTPKAYQTLLVLLQNRNEIVDKEFLLSEIWADTFVEETTLSQNILTLRKALARFQKEKDFIVTFPRRGYRFVADVEEFVCDEEILVIEKRTLTHIVAEQRQIHDSADANSDAISVRNQNNSLVKTFFSAKTITLTSVAILFLIISFFSIQYLFQAQRVAVTKIQSATIFSDSDIRKAIVSPNGKYLAVVDVKEDLQSLSLRQIETGTTIKIVPSINGSFIGAAFSLDSEQIYYSIYETSDSNTSHIGSLYKISILGGASQKILNNIDSPPAISPEKKRISFVRLNLESKETAIIITDIDGKNERSLSVRKLDEGFTNTGVAWSPDGKLLSAAVNRLENNKKSAEIAVVDSETGEQKFISQQNWNWTGQTAWLKDGKGIVVAAFRPTSPTVSDEICLVSYPSGKINYLTSGINRGSGLSVDAESNSIVAVKTDKITCFLSAALANFRKSNLISTRIGDSCLLPFGADWTNDGQIAYSTAEGGNADIWTTTENGGGKKQLTSEESAEILPQISKDGRFLVFLSNRSAKMNIWRTNADGTNPFQLTENENVVDVIISPDNNTLFFVAQNEENITQTLWRVSMNGENKTQITSRMTKSPRISPDGKTIACYYSEEGTNKMSLTLLSTETGKVIRHIETPPNDNIPFLDWSKDGENLYLILQQGKPFSLWKLTLSTTKTEKLREWENDAIFRFVISKDGEKVFYEVGTEITSVVQFQDFAQLN